MADEKAIFSGDIQEETVLENLGYQQELKRSFGLLGMVGFSFSIVTSWTALGSVLIIGVESGGPPVMIWSWIGISICALAVAYSLAEICSAYPVAGGQYSWVALLAPPKIARGMSWVTGWFMITGQCFPCLRRLGVEKTTPRYLSHGCYEQLHWGKLHLGPSELVLSKLHYSTLAHRSCRLLHSHHMHNRQYLRPTST